MKVSRAAGARNFFILKSIQICLNNIVTYYPPHIFAATNCGNCTPFKIISRPISTILNICENVFQFQINNRGFHLLRHCGS